MLIFQCAHCHRQLQIEEKFAGKPVACPACGEVTAPANAPTAIQADPPIVKPVASGPVDNSSPKRAEPSVKREGDTKRERLSDRRSSWWLPVTIMGLLGGVFCCCLPAVLVPAVYKIRQASAQADLLNRYRQIGLGLHNHHDTYMYFPAPAKKNQQGQPIDLSWRVDLLPFVEQAALFNTFDKNVDFDAPANNAIQSVIVPTYATPTANGQVVNQTNMQYFTGPNTPFPTKLTAPRVASFTDGTSNTFLVGEALTPVPWAKADDMKITPQGALPLPSPKFFVVMGDGRSLVVDRTRAEPILRLLIDPKDGNPIPGGWDN